MSAATLAAPPGAPGVTAHSGLTGLGADDHTQYALLAGRAGGQLLNGGTLASQELILRGTTNANLGLIRARSPIVFDDVSPANALSPYSVADTSAQAFTAAFIGGTFNASPTITFTNGVFIWEGLRGAPNIQSLVSPAFAAFTLFQALPLLRAGAAAGQNPLNALVLNAGVTQQNEFSGTKTVASSYGMNFAAQLRTTAFGAVLNCTSFRAVNCSPSYSTVAGSAISFGNIAGIFCSDPAPGLFQPSAGTESMTSYVGLDWSNITFGGNVTKAAVRSAQAAASNAYFLLHTGTAKSYFSGPIHLRAANVGIHFGAADSVQINWNGSALEFDPAIGPDLRWTANALNYWTLSGSAAAQGLQFNKQRISFGTSAPDPAASNWFTIFAGPNLRGPTAAGGYADVLWTAGGTIDVGGFAITDLSAFQINAVSTILSGGTIADSSTLFVNAMASANATRLQALRVLGRSRHDGLMTHNQATLAQLTANVVQLTLPPNNAGRFVLLEDADALGPWTIRGILRVQDGDCFYIVNTGANAFVLGHQDGAAAAADRIISPTGANLTLGQDEMAKLWYDSSVTRWRILEHTGA